MGHTLIYHSCLPINAERETEIRRAADAFNEGRDWVLRIVRGADSGKLICTMEPKERGRTGTDEGRWPGPYEAKCIVDGLCEISRNCHVDWEIRATYAARPVGSIREGVCHSDPEAHAEAMRSMRAKLDGRNGD